MKFENFSEKEKINYIKEEFMKLASQLRIDPKILEKELNEEQFKAANEFAPQLKEEGCTCGECVDMAKVDGRIPKELEPLLAIARKHCEERTY